MSSSKKTKTNTSSVLSTLELRSIIAKHKKNDIPRYKELLRQADPTQSAYLISEQSERALWAQNYNKSNNRTPDSIKAIISGAYGVYQKKQYPKSSFVGNDRKNYMYQQSDFKFSLPSISNNMKSASKSLEKSFVNTLRTIYKSALEKEELYFNNSIEAMKNNPALTPSDTDNLKAFQKMVNATITIKKSHDQYDTALGPRMSAAFTYLEDIRNEYTKIIAPTWEALQKHAQENHQFALDYLNVNLFGQAATDAMEELFKSGKDFSPEDAAEAVTKSIQNKIGATLKELYNKPNIKSTDLEAIAGELGVSGGRLKQLLIASKNYGTIMTSTLESLFPNQDTLKHNILKSIKLKAQSDASKRIRTYYDGFTQMIGNLIMSQVFRGTTQERLFTGGGPGVTGNAKHDSKLWLTFLRNPENSPHGYDQTTGAKQITEDNVICYSMDMEINEDVQKALEEADDFVGNAAKNLKGINDAVDIAFKDKEYMRVEGSAKLLTGTTASIKPLSPLNNSYRFIQNLGYAMGMKTETDQFLFALVNTPVGFLYNDQYTTIRDMLNFFLLGSLFDIKDKSSRGSKTIEDAGTALNMTTKGHIIRFFDVNGVYYCSSDIIGMMLEPYGSDKDKIISKPTLDISKINAGALDYLWTPSASGEVADEGTLWEDTRIALISSIYIGMEISLTQLKENIKNMQI